MKPSAKAIILCSALGLLICLTGPPKAAKAQESEFKYSRILTVHNLTHTAVVVRDFPLVLSLQDPALKHSRKGGNIQSKEGTDIAFQIPGDQSEFLPAKVISYDRKEGKMNVMLRLDKLNTNYEEIVMYYGGKENENTLFGELYPESCIYAQGFNNAERFSGREYEDGVIGQSLYLKNQKDPSFYKAQSAQFRATSNVSAMAWIKIPESGNDISAHLPILKLDGYDCDLSLKLAPGNGKNAFSPRIVLENAGEREVIKCMNELEVITDKWYQIGFSYEKQDGIFTFYWNGKQKGFPVPAQTCDIDMELPDVILGDEKNPLPTDIYMDEILVFDQMIRPTFFETEFNNMASLYYPGRCLAIGEEIPADQMQYVKPAELLYFNGTCQGETVDVEWITEYEYNLESFNLERSADSKSFDFAGNIPAKGFSEEATEYLFKDQHQIEGKSYYRLNEFTFDGKEVYTELIGMNCSGEENLPTVYLFPNPFQSVLEIAVFNLPKKQLNIEISLKDGKKVKNFSYDNTEANDVHKRYTLEDLKPLDYIVSITSGDFVDKKIVKKE